MKRGIAFALTLVLILSSAGAFALAEGADLAEGMYAEGMKAYDAGEYDTAFAYFQIAGDIKGYDPALNMMGICYRDGLGIERNLEESERCFSLAAQQGNKEAASNLAAMQAAAESEGEAAYQAAVELFLDRRFEEAKPAFEALNGYSRSADFLSWIEKLDNPSSPQISLQAGMYLLFGAYEQDNNLKNGKEPIEWLVLTVENNRALLISRYALDCKTYNETRTDITWETCTLRTWLNNSFLEEAFSVEEQSQIIIATVSADKNPKYKTDPGNATQDKVFLLSIAEAEKYFESEKARACAGTEYCYAQGAYKNSTNGNCWWWLRSPGNDSSRAANVYTGGSVHYYGDNVIRDDNAIRPALWIDINTLTAKDVLYTDTEEFRAPEIKSVILDSDNYPVVQWSPVFGAKEYQIYRSYDSGPFYLEKTQSETTYKTSCPSAVSTVTFKVCAVAEDGSRSEFSSEKSASFIDPYYVIGNSENTFSGLYNKMCLNLDLTKHPIPKPMKRGTTYDGGDYEYFFEFSIDKSVTEDVGYVYSKSGSAKYVFRAWAGKHKTGANIRMMVYYDLDGRFVGYIQRDVTHWLSNSNSGSPYRFMQEGSHYLE